MHTLRQTHLVKKHDLPSGTLRAPVTLDQGCSAPLLLFQPLLHVLLVNPLCLVTQHTWTPTTGHGFQEVLDRLARLQKVLAGNVSTPC